MDELLSTFEEEFEGATDEFSKERYKNSAILFSKALFALSDFVILKKMNRLPKNHSERFRILEKYFPDIYLIIDDIFDKYTDSYSKPVLKETCEMMKVGIKKFSEISDLPEGIVEIIGKV